MTIMPTLSAPIALPEIDNPAFAAAFDRFAGAQVVLLGESTHGTSEFYSARAAITRRLVECHGFGVVALEANWADASCLDDWVRLRPRRQDAPPAFQGFPGWMWRNAETASLLSWLRGWNAERGAEAQVAIHGLDMRNPRPAADAVRAYLRGADPQAAPQAVLQELLRRARDLDGADKHRWVDAVMAARVVASYAVFDCCGKDDFTARWNVRDTHMAETLLHLLQASGASAKVVVWAHNSHVGNHAHNEFGRQMGMLSLGQLLKEKLGDAARAVGFGTHAGTFLAAREPGGAVEVMDMPPALAGSWDGLCHATGLPRFLLDLRHPPDTALLSLPQRGLGTVHRPDAPENDAYFDAILWHEFDAWVWLDATTALHPLPGAADPSTQAAWPFPEA